MAYRNIRFVKLMLELAEDDRFTIDCNDNDKFIYLLLLLSAGLTGNKIPERPEWLLKRFNLSIKKDEISMSIQHIVNLFSKVYKQRFGDKLYLKFKGFERLHNWIENNRGSSKGVPKQSQDKIRIDKNIIDKTTKKDIKIILLFAYKKKIKEFTEETLQSFIKRNIRTAQLLKGYSQERLKEVMDWLIKNADFKWTMESVSKYVDENLKELDKNTTKTL